MDTEREKSPLEQHMTSGGNNRNSPVTYGMLLELEAAGLLRGATAAPDAPPSKGKRRK